MPTAGQQPKRPKLEWKWENTEWVCYIFNGAIDCMVKEAMQPGGYGKYEVIVGCYNYSRKRNKYWETPDEAKVACEELLKTVCKALLTHLAPEVLVKS